MLQHRSATGWRLRAKDESRGFSKSPNAVVDHDGNYGHGDDVRPCAQRGSATSGDKLIELLRNAVICESARAAGDRGSSMLRKEAEREIIREWMSLPEGERQTEHQAAQFALRMKPSIPSTTLAVIDTKKSAG